MKLSQLASTSFDRTGIYEQGLPQNERAGSYSRSRQMESITGENKRGWFYGEENTFKTNIFGGIAFLYWY